MSVCSSLGEFLERLASDEGQGRAGSCVGSVFKLMCVLKLEVGHHQADVEKLHQLSSRRNPAFSALHLIFETEPC